jgi:glycosyltransferase involved in cell wall biosynthesis
MDNETTGKPDISIIIPVYNEEGNVEPLYGQLKQVLSALGKPYEIIFIDDGSTDNTYRRLKSLADPGLRIVRFQRNFGKASAFACGFSCARGKVIITMDGDLQDDPVEIPRFIEALNTYEVVSGWKHQRKDPPGKVIPSRIFNAMASVITGVRVHDFNCGYKAYRGYAVEHLNIYGDMHRYIPAIAHLNGYSVGEIEVEHHPRSSGRSKYGAGRLFKGFMDLITVKFLMTYARRPLHAFGFIGVALSFIGLIICSYLAYLWASGVPIGSRPLLNLGVLLITIGIQFVAIGLIGELIVSGRKGPDWIIKKD